MEAFVKLLIDRTGYPAYRSIARAARESGVSQSLLSEYVRGTRKPDPHTLKRFGPYLQRSYNDLLIMVWGDESQPYNDSGDDRSSIEHTEHYVYKDRRVGVLDFPRVGERLRVAIGA